MCLLWLVAAYLAPRRGPAHERRPIRLSTSGAIACHRQPSATRSRTRVSWDEAAAAGDATWIRVLTLNAHQGLGAADAASVLRIRDALRAAGADLVFLQEMAARRGGVRRISTRYLADRSGRSTPTAAMLLRPVGITAMRCSRSIRSSLAECRCIGWRVRAAGHAPLCDRVPQARRHCTRSACISGCASRTAGGRSIGLLDLVVHEVPDGAPLVIAGDFNDWRERAHRRLVLSASRRSPCGRGRPSGAHVSGARPCSGSTGFTSGTSGIGRWRCRAVRGRLSDHAPLAGEVQL